MYYSLRMAHRNGKVLVSAWVDALAAERFKAVARASDGSVSRALARMVGEAIDDPRAVSPSGVGQSEKLTIRFREQERAVLAEVARRRHTSPTNWVRSLALVHLMRKPEWNGDELEQFRDVVRELRRIGSNINQIAAAVNKAAAVGHCPPEAADAAKEATQTVHSETRRLAAILTGNFDYWGLPDELHPRATRAGSAASEANERRAKAKRKLRPRRRPARFKD